MLLLKGWERRGSCGWTCYVTLLSTRCRVKDMPRVTKTCAHKAIVLHMQAFIYALCQAGIRPNITKLLDWGLSRTMTEMGQMGAQDWAHNTQPAGKTK